MNEPESSRSTQRISFIGCGAVGTTLARLWQQRATFEIAQIYCQTADSASRAVRYIGAGSPISSFAQLEPVDLLCIATPDDVISDVAQSIADRCGLEQVAWGAFHCSGAKSAAELSPLAEKGIAIAALHPIFSFASIEQAIANFAGAYCALDGDSALVECLETVMREIGCESVQISSEAKPLYHCANVFVSNLVVALLDVGLELFAKVGIAENEARALITPLLTTCVDNILQKGTDAALTGPIARGDMKTIAAHCNALEENQSECIQELYQMLSVRALQIAVRSGRVSDAVKAELLQLLQS